MLVLSLLVTTTCTALSVMPGEKLVRANASHFPPLEFRFKYYLGKQDGCPKPKNIGFRAAGDHLFLYPCGIELPFPCEECTSGIKDLAGGNYARDLAQLCEHTPLKLALPVTLGDGLTRWQSVVGKARSVGGCGALMPLNTPRHWPTVPSLSDWLFNSSTPSTRECRIHECLRDEPAAFRRLLVPNAVPWSQKKRELTWRGATTGLRSSTRKDYVHALGRSHDVGFAKVVQGKQNWANESWMVKGKMSPEEMLHYRYLLSLEGNDVATDLKWKLSSNSLVIMPPPTKETWLMEGLLQPWVHYVPLRKPSDIEATLAWLDRNDDACLRMIANANDWMKNILQPADITPLMKLLRPPRTRLVNRLRRR